MMILLYILLLGFLFYLFNELEDESVRGNWQHHAAFLNTEESWKNKWAYDEDVGLLPSEKKWYYFGVIPPHKERFPFSSTILVFLTDGEHLFQFLKFRMLDIAFLIISWKLFVAFEVGKLVSSFVKEKFFKHIQ